MRDVRSIVRDLLKDDTVREKKPFEPMPSEERKVSPPPTEKRVVYTPPPYAPPIREEKIEKVEEVVDGPVSRCQYTDTGLHAWEWKSGVKKCWLCNTPAPIDRRDASTGWNGKTSRR